MTSGDMEKAYSEPSLTEFASELSAAADDALVTLSAPMQRGQHVSGKDGGAVSSLDLQTIMRIPVTMKVVVGSATLPVSDLKNLRTGETISLNRRVGEPVDVVVNGQVLARGVLVIVDKETSQLGISLTEVVGAGGSFAAAPAARR
jgi:flagellar motor switch protein FliN/FliY